MSESKWDGAIRELAQAVGEKARQPTTPQIGYDLVANVLRERLVPLLDAADKAADQLYDAAYDDEPLHHRKANKLKKAVSKWLTK